MKTGLKTSAICIVTLLILTISGQCLAVSAFTDLAGVGAKDKILALQEEGYVKGVADGTFAPGKTITAAESVQLIVNALKLNLDTVRFVKAPLATDYFQKADNDAWYANALIIAAVNNLELPADIDPDQECTRQEFTYYLIHALENHANLPMINLVPVKMTDEAQIEASYSGAIQRALVYGVVKLDAEGKFNPTTGIIRADAAEQVYNALEYLKAHAAPATA